MSKYDVYGVGNALVDKEFEVSEEFFVQNDIEKGLMTLVSDEDQQRLLACLTETAEFKKQAGGGSAANTLYALSQFGGNAYYSCKVANDETGDYYLEQLGHVNIETNMEGQRQDGTSGRCLVMISPDAERTMHTYLGVSADISEYELNFDAVRQSSYIYLEGYLVTSHAAKAAIIALKKYAEKNNIKTAMTFSDPAMVEYFLNEVNEVLGTGVDLLFCNEKEALLWSGMADLDSACEALKAKAGQFAITRGAQGALLYDGKKMITIEPHPVKAIDTNGAGDMFAGAFLYALSKGKKFEQAGKLASLASATTVSHFGPRLTPEMHQQILRQVED